MPLSSRTDRLNAHVALTALAMLLLSGIALNTFVDPDIFHEMALIREACALGRLPLQDPFAYTPTVYPIVHHEWGTGVLSYFVATRAGVPGILTLKYLLTAAIAAGCVVCARRGGAGLPVLCMLAPTAIFMGWIGFTTIRAQMYTLLLLVCLIYFLDRDREGGRWWIGPWLALYLLWVNLHAGFAVGLILFLLHAAEQLVRRKPVRHLVLVGLTMIGLVAVNPYGIRYYPFLWQALWMDRPLIPEWAPLWEATSNPMVFCLILYVVSLLVLGYAIYRVGFRKMLGLTLVLILAYAALRHRRHLSLYAVAWLCYVPRFIEGTRLGEMLTRAWTTRPRATLFVWTLVGLISAVGVVRHRPWELSLPANECEHRVLIYPVGAVDYLEQVDFRGNLMVPFTVGAFITWKLHPDVKVSLDGRYEVAYPPEALVENHAYYMADPGWQETLDRYPTDAVLVPRSQPISEAMPRAEGWNRVYRDDVYEIYVRPSLTLPVVDR
ncbi:MAG: hypothetical protein O7B25_04815, partial [Gammaproteobacteria bacterium]|nr:hypothetical protein [Gammaproteobacteria bacterium]